MIHDSNSLNKWWLFSGIISTILLSILSLALIIGWLYIFFNDSETEDISTIITQSIELTDSWEYEWKFVSLTWDITVEEKIWDRIFLQPWKYLYMERVVEVFSWKENIDSEWNITYVQEWTQSPADSNTFAESDGHKNIEKTIESMEESSMIGKIQNYNFDLLHLRLPEWKRLKLNQDVLIPSINLLITKTLKEEATEEIMRESLISGKELTKQEIVKAIIIRVNAKKARNRELEALSIKEREEQKKLDIANRGKHAYKQDWDFLFVGSENISSPEIWDQRISYNVIPEDTRVTLFGQVEWEEIIEYKHSDTLTIYSLKDSDRVTALGENEIKSSTTKWLKKWLWIFIILLWISLLIIIFRNQKIQRIKKSNLLNSKVKYHKSINTDINNKSDVNEDKNNNQWETAKNNTKEDLEVSDIDGQSDNKLDLDEEMKKTYNPNKINDLLNNKEESTAEYIDIKSKNWERKVSNLSKAADKWIIRSEKQIEKKHNKNFTDDEILDLLNQENK